jgi:uncharacterized protein (TIGR02001 family)
MEENMNAPYRNPAIGAALALFALALPAAAEDAPEFTVASNVGVVSDYVSRGLQLNWGNPALQGGVDVMHRSGWYVAAWGSQVTDNFYAGGALELDLYAGHRGSIGDALTYDAGLAAYFYPGANYRKAAPVGAYPDKRYDTTEAVFGITWRWLNLKYSHCLTDYYGYDDRTVPLSVWNSGVFGGVDAGKGTRGSGYLEANANLDLGNTYTLGLHAGHQSVANSSKLSYSDYKLGMTKAFADGWTASLAVTATQGAELYRNFLSVAGNGKTANVDGVHWLLGVNKAF